MFYTSFKKLASRQILVHWVTNGEHNYILNQIGWNDCEFDLFIEHMYSNDRKNWIHYYKIALSLEKGTTWVYGQHFPEDNDNDNDKLYFNSVWATKQN